MFGFQLNLKKDNAAEGPFANLMPAVAGDPSGHLSSPSAATSLLTSKSSGPSSAQPTPSRDEPFPPTRSSTMRLNKNNGKSEDDIMPSDIVPTFTTTRTLQSFSSGEESATPRAVVGAKIHFKGELSGEEDLLIQGRVEGTIDLKGHNLTVGKLGVVKANLIAKTITIEGTVEGDLYAQERISIKASSEVTGNLVADRVTLEDGAKFRGTIDMESNKKAEVSTVVVAKGKSEKAQA